MVTISFQGYNEIARAIQQFPIRSKAIAQAYFVRGLATLDRVNKTSPWRVGNAGGGVPYATGNLRNRGHYKEIHEYEAVYGASNDLVPYAGWVHEGTSRMAARPWLDSVKETSQVDIEKLQEDMIESLTNLIAE